MKGYKLESWSKSLLDTSKANRLIAFKPTSSYLELLAPSPFEIYQKAEKNPKFEIFLPKEDLYEKENPLSLFFKEEEEKKVFLQKEAYLKAYQDELKPNQILLYAKKGNLSKSLRNLLYKSNEHLDSTGVNVLFLALYTLTYFSKEDGSPLKAPLFLLPCRLERASSLRPYKLILEEEDNPLNPALSHLFASVYGLDLPEKGEESFEEYLNRLKELLPPHGFMISGESYLGLFPFLKLNMYRDLLDNEEKVLANPNVLTLLGEPLNVKEVGEEKEKISQSIHNVLDADSSQIAAIKKYKEGQSFILQGPPGTGKSQTIVNILSEALYEGKKVLFVSEKTSALEVVYNRLKQEELDEFCLSLHSHKANKSEVIDELCRTLILPKLKLSSKAKEDLGKRDLASSRLSYRSESFLREDNLLQASVYDLYDALLPLEGASSLNYQIKSLEKKGKIHLEEVSSCLEGYSSYVEENYYDYRDNPLNGYKGEGGYYGENELSQTLEELFPPLETLLGELELLEEEDSLGVNCLLGVEPLCRGMTLIGKSPYITLRLLNPGTISDVCKSVARMAELASYLNKKKETLLLTYGPSLFRLEPKKALSDLNSASNPLKRLFSKPAREALRNLKDCHLQKRKIPYEEGKKLYEELSVYSLSLLEFKRLEESVKPYLGEGYKGLETDFSALLNELDALLTLLSNPFFELNSILEMTVYSFEQRRKLYAEKSERILSCYQSCLEGLEKLQSLFDPEVVSFASLPLSGLHPRLNAMKERLPYLESQIKISSIIKKLGEKGELDFLHLALSKGVLDLKECYQRLYYEQHLDRLRKLNPVLSLSKTELRELRNEYKEKKGAETKIHGALIKEKLSALRPNLELTAPSSLPHLLLKEGKKKRRKMALRPLFKELDELLFTLKPIFLMSPLSVSTYLSSDVAFDLVIFDEASQVLLEDALPAIYRGKQLIVVGDSKQMPPSDFFKSSLEGEESEVKDFDSVLGLASAYYPSVKLLWHYRSKHESLIEFSNRYMYKGELLTLPSRRKGGFGYGVNALKVDGVYARGKGTNLLEAKKAIEVLKESLSLFPNRSYAIIANGIPQQELILDLLEEECARDPGFELALNKNTKEPLLVRNLETIQGEERDTVIYSLTYGKDEGGRFTHNFGPLNKEGGERRLNVALTRARENYVFLYSLEPHWIEEEKLTHEGVKMLKAFLIYLSSGVLPSFEFPSTQELTPFQEELYQALKDNGFEVEKNLGSSKKRIPLAVIPSSNKENALAVLIDSELDASFLTPNERERLYPGLLKSLGWTVVRIDTPFYLQNVLKGRDDLLKSIQGALTFKEKKENKQPSNQEVSFANVKADYGFAEFVPADLDALAKDYLPQDFLSFVLKAIEEEGPLREESFLKRIAKYFSRDFVTPLVKRRYEELMRHCASRGILRQRGFLYLQNQDHVPFKKAAAGQPRALVDVSLEELYDGLYQIVKENFSLQKSAAFVVLNRALGHQRLSKAEEDRLESALTLKDGLKEENGLLSLSEEE